MRICRVVVPYGEWLAYRVLRLVIELLGPNAAMAITVGCKVQEVTVRRPVQQVERWAPMPYAVSWAADRCGHFHAFGYFFG